MTAAILTTEGMEGKIIHGYKHAGAFHKEARPGGWMEMEDEILSFQRGLCKEKVKGYIDGELACDLESVIIIPDVFNQFKPKVTNNDG